MTTHRRALLLRAGAVAALVTGALVGVATPAHADDSLGLTVGPTNFDLKAGDSRDFGVEVENKTTSPQNINIVINTPDAIGGDLTLAGKSAGCNQSGPSINCTVPVPMQLKRQFTFTISAKSTISVPPGQSKEGDGGVTASLLATGSQEVKNLHVKLSGPAQAPSGVTEVSGVVADSATVKALKDATVVLIDGANKSRQVGSDAQGRFKFTSTQADPIAPGTLSLTATKDGYDTGAPSTFDARAGQIIANRSVRLRQAAATATPSVPVATDGPATTAPTGVANADTAQANTKTSSGSGTSPFSWLLIGLGALLVLLGIGAIVLLLRKRDDGDDPDDDEPAQPVRRGPPGGAPPGYRGAAADPTMVSHTAMGAPAMAGGRANSNDATAIVRAPRMPADETYAAPPRGGYPPPGPSYGPPAGAGYGGQPGYLGSPNGGYGGQSGYDGPAGYDAPAGYGAEPPPAGGYSPSSGYGPSSRPAADGYGVSDYAGDYGQPRGYGEEPPPRYDAGGYGAGGYEGGGGYGGANGYDPRAGYEAPGGYEAPAGYEAPGGGYDRDGYERPPEQPRHGGGSSGYYDNEGPPSSRPAPPRAGERRSIDWLDD